VKAGSDSYLYYTKLTVPRPPKSCQEPVKGHCRLRKVTIMIMSDEEIAQDRIAIRISSGLINIFLIVPFEPRLSSSHLLNKTPPKLCLNLGYGHLRNIPFEPTQSLPHSKSFRCDFSSFRGSAISLFHTPFSSGTLGQKESRDPHVQTPL